MVTLCFTGYPHLRRYASGVVVDGIVARGDKRADGTVSDGLVSVSEADAEAILADHPVAFALHVESAPKPETAPAKGAKKGE